MSNSSLKVESEYHSVFQGKEMQDFLINTNKKRTDFIIRLKQQLPESTIRQALNTLPADTALVMRLHYLEGLSLKSVTLVLGKSISVVRNHRNRGVFRLYQSFHSLI